jgi:hypothetical protein
MFPLVALLQQTTTSADPLLCSEEMHDTDDDPPARSVAAMTIAAATSPRQQTTTSSGSAEHGGETPSGILVSSPTNNVSATRLQQSTQALERTPESLLQDLRDGKRNFCAWHFAALLYYAHHNRIDAIQWSPDGSHLILPSRKDFEQAIFRSLVDAFISPAKRVDAFISPAKRYTYLIRNLRQWGWKFVVKADPKGQRPFVCQHALVHRDNLDVWKDLTQLPFVRVGKIPVCDTMLLDKSTPVSKPVSKPVAEPDQRLLVRPSRLRRTEPATEPVAEPVAKEWKAAELLQMLREEKKDCFPYRFLMMMAYAEHVRKRVKKKNHFSWSKDGSALYLPSSEQFSSPIFRNLVDEFLDPDMTYADIARSLRLWGWAVAVDP